MRIGIGRFWTESNSWSPLLCDLEMFRCGALYEGNEMLAFYRQGPNEVSGFLESLDRAGFQAIPLLGAHASCAGPLKQTAWQYLFGRFQDRLRAAGQLDGVLLSLHGSAMSEEDDDLSGMILQATRECVGPDVPIVATLDMHGNPTRRMASHADALVAYKTYPHRDFVERGRQAADILIGAVKGDTRPLVSVTTIPLELNSLAVLEQLIAKCTEAEQNQRVLACSIMPAHAALDVAEFHPLSAVVVTDGDADLSRQIGRQLMWQAWSSRVQGAAAMPLLSISEALERLPSLPPGVIVMADRNDSVTAGFPGDCPEIIRQLLELNVRDRACVIVNDPEFVRLALQAGVGHEVAGPLGGKWGGSLYGPVHVRAHVRLLSDGTLLKGDDTSPGHLSVSNSSMGTTAVVEINGTITVVVTSVPVMSTDPTAYRSVGVEPREYRIVVTKSVAQQRYNFASIASGFIDLDGPGWLKVAATYQWKKRPPMAIYPHAPVTDHTIRRLLGLEHRPVDLPLKETV